MLCLFLLYSNVNQLCWCSAAKSCWALFDPMDCRMPGFPVLLYLRKFAHIHNH